MNEYEDNDIDISREDIDNIIKQEMVSRQRQDNISFFGFTGTPKPSTLEVFGTPQSDGTRNLSILTLWNSPLVKDSH